MPEVICPFCGGRGSIPVPERPLEIQVALRAGGMFSRLEWAFLITPRGEVKSFNRDGRFVKREGGLNYYALPASPGDIVVQGYLSGSGKTYRLGLSRVGPDGSLEPIIEFDNPYDAESHLRAIGVSEKVW